MQKRSEAKVAFEGKLFLGRFLVVFVGQGGQSAWHSHHAVQLVVAREGTFELTTGDGARRVRSACIPAGEPHAFDASTTEVALVLVDRHHGRGALLDEVVWRGAVEAAERLLRVPFPGRAPGEAIRAADAWVEVLLAEAPPRIPISRAVRRAIQHLENAIAAHEAPSLAAAAAAVELSPTRLTHRFSAEVGAPFRALVPWLRIARAVAEISKRDPSHAGRSLTEAAHAAGFVDQGHMSRTFRRAFGLPPAAFFGASEVVSLVDGGP